MNVIDEINRKRLPSLCRKLKMQQMTRTNPDENVENGKDEKSIIKSTQITLKYACVLSFICVVVYYGMYSFNFCFLFSLITLFFEKFIRASDVYYVDLGQLLQEPVVFIAHN